MKLATIRTASGTSAARVEDDHVVVLPFPDMVALLHQADWRAAAGQGGEQVALDEVAWDAAVRPVKTVCVGLNYRTHILEMGHELPDYPSLFAKYPEALTGPYDDIALPPSAKNVDWEVELGIVMGSIAVRVSEGDALRHVAGYTVVNDVSVRDWQMRTTQWFQGKNFEASTPVGPVVVTGDEVDDGRDLEVRCELDDSTVQSARTSDLLFGPAAVVSYISQFITLQPGDLIATGTPGGVGQGRTPKMFIQPGQRVRTTVEGIGSLLNTFTTIG